MTRFEWLIREGFMNERAPFPVPTGEPPKKWRSD
jgi:hypothetical protein